MQSAAAEAVLYVSVGFSLTRCTRFAGFDCINFAQSSCNIVVGTITRLYCIPKHV